MENYKVFAEELVVLFKDMFLRIDEETNASMVIPDLKRRLHSSTHNEVSVLREK